MENAERAQAAIAEIGLIAQREYEDSLTFYGRVADAEYMGRRIAADIVAAFPGIVEVVSAAIGAEGHGARAGYQEHAD